MPNNLLALIAVALLGDVVSSYRALPSTGTPLHSDFFVASQGNDHSDGSSVHPWATIQHAATLVHPGATVHVAPGDYTGGFTTQVTGSADSRVRFLSDVRWGARIKSLDSYATWKNLGDYVDINGFDVSGAGCVGILNAGSHVRIINNLVHDVQAPASRCRDNGGGGIDKGE